jgi:AmiR/NasT family two-component response regulator
VTNRLDIATAILGEPHLIVCDVAISVVIRADAVFAAIKNPRRHGLAHETAAQQFLSDTLVWFFERNAGFTKNTAVEKRAIGDEFIVKKALNGKC